MKAFSVIFFILLFSISVPAQAEAEPTSRKALESRILKREFPSVPQSIRDIHAQGMIRVLARVDEEGSVKNATLVSFTGFPNLKDYIEKAVAGWKFKPLEVNGERTAFALIVEIPFCYGGFSSRCRD